MIDKTVSYEFSAEKNQQLINKRGVSFEEVIAALEAGKLLDILEHHNRDKYAHQRVYVVDMND